MSNDNKKKSKNNFSKSMKYIISQAKKGSKVHIAMIAGATLILIFSIVLLRGMFRSCSVEKNPENEVDQAYDKDKEKIDVEQLGNTVLELTKDAGQEYIDNTLFIGDSNTVRTLVYGYTKWDNVVAAMSMGVQHIPSLKMTYFKGMKSPVTTPEAVKIIQPQRIIITFGTNNTVGYKIEDFIKMYKEGLDAIVKAWPYADIIINSIPPVDKQRENLSIKMQTIDEYNKALAELAKKEGYKFLNSSEALKDEKTGFAKKDFTIGDGIHLSKKGTDALFEYIKTHAYIAEDRRPKPLKPVPEREETPASVITEDPLAVRGTKIKIVFQSSDTSLGKVEGEVEQKLKRTITSQAVTAVPNKENGGIFTGWSCSYEGLSSTTEPTVTYKVPKVSDDVTEIVITANFAKAGISIQHNNKHIDKINLKKGETKQLTAKITGDFNAETKIKWESDDKNVATIDENGNLTAVNGGKTQIYASILDSKIYAVCEVTVSQALEEIKILGETTLQKGAKTNLQLVFVPDGASADKNNAEWTSSDNSIATVSQNGEVTAVGNGEVTITAKLDDFVASHKINVTRPKPLNGISLTGKTELVEGEKAQLTINYDPVDTTDSKLAKWESDNTAVASVVDGTVIANSEGTANIKCTVGKSTSTIKITVKKEANYVSSISISQSDVSVSMGSSVSITATPTLAFPDRPDGVDLSQHWSSINGYVTVANGVIVARSDLTSESGTLIDTVTVTIGGKSASCTVTITGVTVPQQTPSENTNSPTV